MIKVIRMMVETLQYSQQHGFLTGKLLVAMPYLKDQRFHHSVIYICGHDENGSMGLIVNKPLNSVNFHDLLEQVQIDYDENSPNGLIHYGGPVEVGRGFVLHTNDYLATASVAINNNFAFTATVEILRAISNNQGPRNALVALGYVSWGAMELEAEIQNNGWLVIEAHENLIFNKGYEDIWHHAMASIGIDPLRLVFDVGHA